ncbi:syntaxin-16-like [Macrosteles quadrilineatus]|uniref:syntaxin-16-like n=1 Tax=Macrosteles quadrilineatus TaxID=74068 RepID=UPI0023E2047C|nr:syntaxin-16-like [Macrosteles quadrilineatus]
MATRSLTDVFVLMRNNASQNRHIYSEQQMTDRMALVGDLECGIELRRSEASRLPPIWADNLEESQYAMTRLRNKLKELEALYDKHVLRPTLDDSTDEERQIEILTQEISRMFAATHRLVQQIHHHSSDATTNMELKLSNNVTASLVTSLQDLSTSFRKLQSSYLKKINSREETSRLFFDSEMSMGRQTDLDWEVDNELDNLDRAFSLSTAQQGGLTQTQTQLLLLEEENTRRAEHREAEVRQIVKSIVDLNDIFKDLAHMVADQGTVLDRIDYNIEQAQVQVHEGYQQLQKADLYHRKNRKMMCILVLSVVTMLLTFILIITKF